MPGERDRAETEENELPRLRDAERVEHFGEELERQCRFDRALDRARPERDDEDQPEQRELHGEVGLVVRGALAHREQRAARGRDPGAQRERGDPRPRRD